MRGYLQLVARSIRGILPDRTGLQVGWTFRRLAVMTLFLPLFVAVQAVHWIGLLADEIFFRAYRDVDVCEPVFIVGVPRSGTTFLHRVLARDTERFTTFTLWELLLAPSISERVLWRMLGRLDGLIGRPGTRLVSYVERAFLGRLDAIHASSLGAPEEDYFALVPAFACFVLVLPFPGSSILWQLAQFDDQVSPAERRRIMEFYKSCLQRHLYVHGPEKTLLSKNPSFTSAIRSLRETFPDCRIVCNVRNPLEAIPSLLSSMREGTRVFYGDKHLDVLQDRFLDILKHYYRHSIITLSYWPEQRQTFVTLGELEKALRETVAGIYARFGYDLSESFADALETEHHRALAYRSTHQYSLDQFGLDPNRVIEDLDYVFDRFDFHAPLDQPCERVG
jgi:hypothetical protein